MECFSGLHGVLPAVPDISHQQNLPVTEHPAAGWPLYESRLKGKLHVISKRYTQRIEALLQIVGGDKLIIPFC